MSIGIATGSGADVVFDPLFRDADNALYAAKARGRDRVTCFDEIRTRQPDDWVDVPFRLTPV